MFSWIFLDHNFHHLVAKCRSAQSWAMFLTVWDWWCRFKMQLEFDTNFHSCSYVCQSNLGDLGSNSSVIVIVAQHHTVCDFYKCIFIIYSFFFIYIIWLVVWNRGFFSYFSIQLGLLLSHLTKIRIFIHNIPIWLVVWNMSFIFPNSWDDDPIWFSYFPEW